MAAAHCRANRDSDARTAGLTFSFSFSFSGFGLFDLGDTYQGAAECVTPPVADSSGDGEVGRGPAGDELAMGDRGCRPRRHLSHPELVAPVADPSGQHAVLGSGILQNATGTSRLRA